MSITVMEMVPYLEQRLEEGGIIDNSPIRTPDGFAHFQARHELVHSGANLVREQRDWQVNRRDIHAHFLQQTPPLGKQHSARDKAE